MMLLIVYIVTMVMCVIDILIDGCGGCASTAIQEGKAVLFEANDEVPFTLQTYLRKQGRVEVFWNGSWNTVCSDWDPITSGVICKQLGLEYRASDQDYYYNYSDSRQPNYGTVPESSIPQQVPLVDVACVGNETALVDCYIDSIEPGSRTSQAVCPIGTRMGAVCWYNNTTTQVLMCILVFFVFVSFVPCIMGWKNRVREHHAV